MRADSGVIPQLVNILVDAGQPVPDWMGQLCFWGGGGRHCLALICAPPLIPLLLHSAHHKDSMYIMTLGNWNDPGQSVRKSVSWLII